MARVSDRPAQTYHEIELREPVSLCDSRARLRPEAAGWSRQPLHTLNISGHALRKKKWNYWCVTSDRHLFSATFADLDYLGVAFVYFLDFETKRFIEETVLVPVPRGRRLPDSVRGDIMFHGRRLSLSFLEDADATRIRVESPSFGGARLSADLRVLRPPEHETLNVVIPWSRERFHFTSKQLCLPASGSVTLGSDRIEFPEGGSFGCLDFGRGVWRYSTFWNWGAFSSVQGGRTVGINAGGAWTDGTGLNENAIWVNGRLSKLHEDLAFEYDRADLMKPWAVRTPSSERLDLRFVPFFKRAAKTDLLLLKSEVQQVIGRYSGTMVPDSGEPIAVDGAVGWVEQHSARW